MVIAGHAAVIYALAMTLGVVEVPPIVKPMTAVFVSLPESIPEPAKPVVRPNPTPEPLPVPMPDVPVISEPVDTAPVAIPLTPDAAPDSAQTTNLSVTRRVDPLYPPASRRGEEEGTVLLRILVDESGRPREVQVAKSSGYPRLDDSAISAVRQWHFSPVTQRSHAVSAWTQVSVVFRLDG